MADHMPTLKFDVSSWIVVNRMWTSSWTVYPNKLLCFAWCLFSVRNNLPMESWFVCKIKISTKSQSISIIYIARSGVLWMPLNWLDWLVDHTDCEQWFSDCQEILDIFWTAGLQQCVSFLRITGWICSQDCACLVLKKLLNSQTSVYLLIQLFHINFWSHFDHINFVLNTKIYKKLPCLGRDMTHAEVSTLCF